MMESGMLARVLHDFFTTVDGELSLSKGHCFLIHEIVDKHWCLGQSQDRFGKFPLSHLHKVEIPEFNETERVFVAVAGFPGQETGDLTFTQGELIIGTRDIGSGAWCMGRTSSRTGIFPTTHTWELDTTLIKKASRKKSIRKRAKVNTTLKAQLEEELDLIAGEMIIVTEILDDGWCHGIAENGKEGIFPEGFISYINEDDEDNTNQAEVTSATSSNFAWPTSRSDTISNDFGEAASISSHVPEEPAPSYFDLFPEASTSTSNITDTQCDTHIKSIDIKPYAITLYPFNAQFPNELNFGAGEVVHLTRHIDSEWMEGMIDTSKGIFPSSYVNVIVDCVEPENVQIQLQVDTTPAKKDALDPGVTVKVLYTFDAQMDGDLSVQEGDVVTVVDMANEDWVNVKNKSGLVGLCPREYLSSAFSHFPDQQESLEESDFVVIRHKEETVTSREEQRPKRRSQPHRPAPPAPALGRVPLQKDTVANAEASVAAESQGNESVTDSMVNVREKRAEQRQNVISELVLTEKEYVRDLKLTYETFNLYNPSSLVSKGIDVATLFGNILEVIHVAEELLDMIRKAMKGRAENLQMVGPCFVKMAEKLKTVYVKYCSNHEAALALLKKYENNEEIMRIFNKGIETLRHQVACFDMSSILIKPVQRILKYPLILYELIKCTEDDHPDKASTEEAWKAMTSVASYINEYKRRKDIVSKYLDNDNTLIGKMSKLSMHSVAKMSTRLSTRLSASLGLTRNVSCDLQFEELEKQFRSIEKCTWQLAKDVEQCTMHLSEEAMSGNVIAEFLGQYYQGTPTSDVKKLQVIRSIIWSQYIPDFKSCVESRVNTPLNLLTTLLEGPAVLISKRYDKLLDYDAAISKSEKYKESKIVQEELFTAKSNYEALNQQLLEELPVLLDSVANILVNCISAFAGARKLLSGRITKQYLTLCESSPHLSPQDVLESFLVNHNLIWNQITRFTFAGTNPRADDQSQAQLCAQSEQQKTLLKAKYAADKLYIVMENVASTSTLDVGATKDTLVAVIKKQDPMGNPARWYVDTGITQGFLPSQKLKPAQQSQPRETTVETNIVVSRKSPPNLMSLDSPEKEIKKLSQSHLQDLLSLDTSNEARANQTYSNAPATPRVQVYQNINSEFYYAMYDFSVDMPGTLAVTAGQALRLLRPHDEKRNDEWWLVENRDGKRGHVPRNYLHSSFKPKS